MRIEYQQTFEDYKEAVRAHASASAHATKPVRAAATIWQLGGAVLTMILLAIYDPWKPAKTNLDWAISRVGIPTFTWVVILAYNIWFLALSGRQTAMFLPPWKRPGDQKPTAVVRSRTTKMFRAAIINFVVAVGLLWYAIYQHSISSDAVGYILPLGFALGYLPWGLYLMWAVALGKITAKQEILKNWHRHTLLHEIHMLEFDRFQVILETPSERTVYKWIAFPGFIETSNVFLLYRSGIMFHIIPKRAFASAELADAFRHMVTTLAGKQASGFEVVMPKEISIEISPE